MADHILDITPVTFIACQRTTHSDVITTTNTFVINQDDIGTDTRDPNVAKIGGSGGGSGRRSMGRVKPLTSRKKHLLLLEEQHAFMTHLHQIRDRRVEIENWAADIIQQVMRAYLERHKKRERPEIDEGERKQDIEAKTNEVTPKDESNEMRFFSTLRQRFALSSDLQADVKALVAMSEDMLEQRLQEAGMAGLPQWKRKAIRKQKQRSDKRRRKALKNRVSTRVQALMRGWMARRAFRMLIKMSHDEKMSQAATKIQSQARVFTTKQSLKAVLEKHVECAKKIQRVYRGWDTRLFVDYIRSELRQRMKRLEASIAIQTLFRGHRAKVLVSDMRAAKAATVLQCAFRSHQARTETMGKKVQQQQEVERRERAATKLQAINRGAKSRQLVKEKKRRRDRARRNQARSQARNQAATKIQSISRRKQAHKKARVRKNAAVTIQSAGRGRIGRKQAKHVKHTKAATQIQAAQRGRSARDTRRNQHQQATRIQSQVRRRRASQRTQEMANEKQQQMSEVDSVEAGAKTEENVEAVQPAQPVSEATTGANSADEAAAATRLQRLTRGRQARGRVDALRAERRRQLSAEVGQTGQRKVKRKKGYI